MKYNSSGYERVSTMEDVYYLCSRLRDSDIYELRASTGQTPYEALKAGVEQSDICLTGIGTRGVPFAMGGIAPSIVKGTGVAWILGTDEVDYHSKSLQRRMRAFIKTFDTMYPQYGNFVMETNKTTIDWLQFWGFTPYAKVPALNGTNEPFLWMVRESRGFKG